MYILYDSFLAFFPAGNWLCEERHPGCFASRTPLNEYPHIDEMNSIILLILPHIPSG